MIDDYGVLDDLTMEIYFLLFLDRSIMVFCFIFSTFLFSFVGGEKFI